MSTLATTNLKHPNSASNNVVLDSSGNVRVTTLADSAGSNTSTPAEIASGRAKAWVNFNGITNAIRASYNVSSITDGGTGIYTISFTSAMSDANYSAVFSTDGRSVGDISPSTGGSSGVYLVTRNISGTQAEHTEVTVAVFR